MNLDLDETHDPVRSSWVASANGHPDFPIQNLPLGIFSCEKRARRFGVAIGDQILDVSALAATPLLTGNAREATLAVTNADLNPLLALGARPRRALRRRLFELLSDALFQEALEPFLYAAADCVLHLPAQIGDYTDFYVGLHHATNIGRLFRPDNPLLPNYKHIPIGYHGRASSVRVSGEPVRRPSGQIKLPDEDGPIFAATRRLDYELELGVWFGPGNSLGEPISIANASDHIAGLCLLNDWSARDFQSWEYQPLGPFLSKNFHTTISPWLVTAEALAPYRIAQKARSESDPTPLPYLVDSADQANGAFEIALTVSLTTEAMRAMGDISHRLSLGSARDMYWTIAQLIAHHTSGGCNLRPGDLFGSGTISAASRTGFGSLIELSRGGVDPIVLHNGETRTFLQDGDEVTFTGRLLAEGRVGMGFGACSARIISARS